MSEPTRRPKPQPVWEIVRDMETKYNALQMHAAAIDSELRRYQAMEDAGEIEDELIDIGNRIATTIKEFRSRGVAENTKENQP